MHCSMGSHFVPSLRHRSSAEALQRNSPGVHDGGSQLGVAPVLQAKAELQVVMSQAWGPLQCSRFGPLQT